MADVKENSIEETPVNTNTGCCEVGFCKECFVINPQTCCEIGVEYETCLKPPAIIGTKFPIIIKREVKAKVKKVCSGKVIISGLFYASISYLSSDCCNYKKNTTNVQKEFECIIDRDDANQGDKFKIVGSEVMCIVYKKAECICECNIEVARKFFEKDIIKICIKRDIPEAVVC